jgi:hypothetical protein
MTLRTPDQNMSTKRQRRHVFDLAVGDLQPQRGWVGRWRAHRTSWVAGIAPDVRATSWQPHLRLQFTSSRLINPVHLIGYMSEAEHRSAARLRIHALTAIVRHDDVSANPVDRYVSDPIGETRSCLLA